MTIDSILVLGGTGKTGRRLVARLRSQGVTAIPASRSGERGFDWADEPTWATALSGVDAVYLVDDGSADPAVTLAPFVELAVASGARRHVLLSARGLETPDAPLPAEAALRASDAEWTILRPTWFAQNFSEDLFLDSMLAGELALSTGEGPDPFIDAEDIAAVAAAVLTQDGHGGEVYELSGPRLMSFGDAAQEVARATGRSIAFRPVSREECVERMVASGADPGAAAFAADVFDGIRAGRNAYLSDGVQRVLKREPRDFAEYARDAAATGVWRP
ncbi:NAD(P)H-binding protein [Streptomyces amakusaensis]|uniref:NAD(P)H-binding protein n=1 Tax=Streptomyces amakusaensis TaxID=67271 RepID=A0ABW0AJ41_9ACTN